MEEKILTQKTAREMGITKRTNPEDSIIGGANYFQKTFDRLPEDVPKLNQTERKGSVFNVFFCVFDMAKSRRSVFGVGGRHFIES